MITNLFDIRARKHARRTWRSVLEDTRVLTSLSLKLMLVLSDGITKERCIAANLFWKACRNLARKSGYLFLVLYLKQSRVVLQRYVAGDSIPSPLSPAISLTRTGLPRIIPSFHRRRIRNGCNVTIQFYMSLFSIGRIIPLSKKVTAQTFESITTPIDSNKKIIPISQNIFSGIESLLDRYVPSARARCLNQAVSCVPTWKSTFSTCASLKVWENLSSQGKCEKSSGRKSIALSFPHELVLARRRASAYLWKSFILTPFAKVENDNLIDSLPLAWTGGYIDLSLSAIRLMSAKGPSGRLCQVLSGDGKRRLFCIGNYFIQRMLYPLHNWLMETLKTIPMDGTFNQPKPFDRLKGYSGTVYSVDLKAATDRWPLDLQIEFISMIFGEAFAGQVRNALGQHEFSVDFTRSKQTVKFAAGQPLGYLSSWPLFAITHHYVIWWLAEQVYPGLYFKRYAILGDDIVIADDRVYAAYLVLIRALGVEVSLSKTLTSKTGCAEFAKRFRLNKLTVDVSPVSLRDLLLTYQPLGWYSVMNTLRVRFCLRYSTYLRLAGLGFRAASRRPEARNNGRKASRVRVMLLHMLSNDIGLHFALSIHIGRIIEPQVVGVLFWKLREAFRPRDLEPPVLPFYKGSEENVIIRERTLYYNWVLSYSKYLEWYSLLEYNFMGMLDIFFEAPFYKTDLYVESKAKDAPIVDRFGVWLRLYDWAKKSKPWGVISEGSNFRLCESVYHPLIFKRKSI